MQTLTAQRPSIEMSKPRQMHCKIMPVSPEQSAKWLENHNTKNRRISKRTVQDYSREIREGRWQLSPEGICFDTDGIMLNGQHRLLAVIETGITVMMVVWFECPVELRKVLDQGLKRRVRDDLDMNGHENTGIMASAEVVIRAYLNNSFNHNSRNGALKDEKVEFIENWPSIDEAAQLASSMYARAKWQKSAMCAFLTFVLPHPELRADLEDFLEKLATGHMLAGNDPILLVRNQYDRLKTMGTKTNNGVKSTIVFAILAKAWNDYMQKNTRTKGFETTTMPKFIYGSPIKAGDGVH